MSHMDRLPAGDQASRAIVAQMADDEVRHAVDAQKAGAMELPGPVKGRHERRRQGDDDDGASHLSAGWRYKNSSYRRNTIKAEMPVSL